ncbi:PRD domain-containing protein [Salibacterium salarium]|uniref:PRD domain-containing protein n=1 Tax=Salibacterium salarium TaxID=284579 RepID=A0A3R9RC20_9BACI|nr:PRD domain-containing protein [Salibacterium salarium]RSL32019.1 PRD domain-containing protein [Salibacterium salarium]
MIIQKVLNHNAAVVSDDKEEKVAIGSGIAFHKKKNDKINPEQVEKLFVLHHEESNPFADLLASASHEDTTFVQEIMSWLEVDQLMNFNNQTYALLFDHFIHLMKRLREGKRIDNYLLQEIKTLYSDSFQIAEKAGNKLSNNTGFSISQDEIGFLAMHLYAAGKKKTSPQLIQKHTETLNLMVTTMEEDLNTIFPRHTIAYEGLVSHLHVTVKAAEYDEDLMKAPGEMIEMMRNGYPDSYRAAKKAVSVLKNQYGLTIPEDESIYIAMHVQRLMSRGWTDESKD